MPSRVIPHPSRLKRRGRASSDRVLRLIAALLCLQAPVWLAGTRSASAQQMSVNQYAQKRALTNPGVQCLEQDRKGFILICTENGAVRYAGHRVDPDAAQRELPSGGMVFDLELARSGAAFAIVSNAIDAAPDTALNGTRYPQIAPERHVFSVMAYDPLNHRSSAPVSFAFTIRPPWWHGWLFLSSCLIAGFAVLATLWQLRIRMLLRRQRQLEALVSERTSEIERARAALFEQATRDSLTGLLNRPAIMHELELALTEAARHGRPFAVALLDLDHFKSINDRFGHLAGDAVLRVLGSRLSAALLDHERAGRYGGEELVLLIPERSAAADRFRILREAMIAAPVPVDEPEQNAAIPVTCSIGVTSYRFGDTPETLLRRADRCLYDAKRAGRDRIVSESDFNSDSG